MSNESILGGLDPELMEEVTTRRGALFGGASWAARMALAAAPLGLAALAKDAWAQSGTIPAAVASVLNFALTLEELEAEFYSIATGTRPPPAGQTVSATLIPAADRAIFETIGSHERSHVAFLREALGSQAVAKPNFDFTRGGTLNPFTSYDTFLVLAQAFEDLGVRAYKGQAPVLQAAEPGNTPPAQRRPFLTAALTIHSVEARHASEVRRLRGQRAGQAEQSPYKGWITLANTTGDAALQPFAAVYGAGNPATTFPTEANTTQGGANTAGLTFTGVTINANNASEAFDEPLDRDTVTGLASLFIRP